MEDSIVPSGLKACLLENSLLGRGGHHFHASLRVSTISWPPLFVTIVTSQIFVSMYVMCHFSRATFKTFSLHLIFSSLTMIYLCVVYFHLCSDWGSLRLVRAFLLDQ